MIESNYLRRMARNMANASRNNVPVVTADNDLALPVQLGRSYYFTTPGGRPVYHPNAYRRAYGKPVYHASTIRVEVGRLFLQYAAVCRLLGFLPTTPVAVVADAVESHVIPYNR